MQNLSRASLETGQVKDIGQQMQFLHLASYICFIH